jgi:predicted nuclease of predicted toxin-antitoxin system
MSIFASLYTDEDISVLVATLLRSRGLDVTTVPERATLGKTDSEQLEFATSLGRCIVTHNRVDFERLHLQFMEEGKKHCGIIVVPQKNAYEVAQRVSILVNTLTVDNINNQLLYA